MQAENRGGRPELIIALVGQAGVGLKELSEVVQDYLKTSFGYKTDEINLSKLLVTNFVDCEVQPHGEFEEYERIRHCQKMGNKFREKLKSGAALTLAGIAEIRAKRNEITKSPDSPAPEQAYIVHQLKHPDEVELLRSVYGSSFILIAGHEIHSSRLKNLAARIAEKTHSPSNRNRCNRFAEELIGIDENEEDIYGQNTRDAYPLADYFADLNSSTWKDDIRRFIDLLFGHPFHTPLPEEHAMYHSKAISLRSSDEGRQVGAVIAALRWEKTGDPNNPLRIRVLDIVASGMNEVPRKGGTLYQRPDSPDRRDQMLSYNNKDPAESIKQGALRELIEKIRRKKWLIESTKSADVLASELLPDLKGTQFMDIGEFMRPVHAEMSALIDSAKRGVAVRSLSMYVTSFPCHNCAKHIIAAGIQRVVYLEPYPKSRAEYLHEDEIDIDAINGQEIKEDAKVAFIPFSGVAPRQYHQVFSMSSRGKKRGPALRAWEAQKTSLLPRYVMRNASAAYLLAERQELEKLDGNVYKWDKEAVCPAKKRELTQLH